MVPVAIEVLSQARFPSYWSAIAISFKDADDVLKMSQASARATAVLGDEFNPRGAV
jgi:hypothetical protein